MDILLITGALQSELTAEDCFALGKTLIENQWYARAMDWFDEAYVLAGVENNKTIGQDQVMEIIGQTIRLVHLFTTFTPKI